jgi:hypothetical protein
MSARWIELLVVQHQAQPVGAQQVLQHHLCVYIVTSRERMREMTGRQ